MANKERGEVTVEANGKTYTLRFSIDAMCQMEEATGKGVIAITQEFADPAKIRMATARAALWAALHEQHPELTLMQVGELIPEFGGLQVVLQKISEAILLAFPKAEGNARPLKAVKTG